MRLLMKLILLNVLILFVVNIHSFSSEDLCRCGQQNQVRQKRIVGGNIVVTNNYPWIVALLDTNNNNQLLCGGTIITERHILTAAHCVFGRKPNDIAIKIGSTKLKDNKDIQHLSKIKCHTKYSQELQDYDIAVLTLRTPLNKRYNKPICLPQLLLLNKTNKARIAGWGKTGFYSNENFDEIRETEVTVGAYNECKNILKEDHIELTDRILCAGDLLGNHDSCQGDSGVPLMSVEHESGIYYAIGLSSFGIGCGRTGSYGIYTKVDYFIDWIISTIGIENMTCQHIVVTK